MAITKNQLTDWINQMPDTDRDLEAIQKNEPDKRGRESKFTGEEWSKLEPRLEALLADGAAGVRDLIGMIRDTSDPEFQSYKAEYLMHALVIYAGDARRTRQREVVVEAMAAQLGNAALAAPVRAFLIRELQLMGATDAAAAMGRLLADSNLCRDAAASLGALGEEGAAQLRAALPTANAACRLAIVNALGAVKDAKAIPVLKQAAGGDDVEVRLSALWALGRIGDAGSVDLMLKAADAEAPYERVKGTQASLLLAENLVAAGNKTDAERIYVHLVKTRTDPKEQYVRDLAKATLGGAPAF